MPGPLEISVVVAVYESAATIASLVQRLVAVLAPLAARYEVILVNDGSRDGSWDRIKALALQRPEVVAIDLVRNSGQHAALLVGIRAARYPITVTLDDDGEQPSEAIGQLVEKLIGGEHDVVFGVASERPRSRWRNLATRLSNFLFVRLNAHGIPPAPLRVFYTALRSAFPAGASPFVSLDVLLNWVVACPAVVKIRYDASTRGSSRASLGQLWNALTEGATGMSLLPLRLASLVGAGFLAVALILSAFATWRWCVAPAKLRERVITASYCGRRSAAAEVS